VWCIRASAGWVPMLIISSRSYYRSSAAARDEGRGPARGLGAEKKRIEDGRGFAFSFLGHFICLSVGERAGRGRGSRREWRTGLDCT